MKLTEFDFGHFIYVCVYCVIVIALRSDSDCNKQATYQLTYLQQIWTPGPGS